MTIDELIIIIGIVAIVGVIIWGISSIKGAMNEVDEEWNVTYVPTEETVQKANSGINKWLFENGWLKLKTVEQDKNVRPKR